MTLMFDTNDILISTRVFEERLPDVNGETILIYAHNGSALIKKALRVVLHFTAI